MNLVDYENQIKNVQESSLSGQEKAAALSLIANTIRLCAWQYHAKSAAHNLAAIAESFSLGLGGNSLDGLDSLADRGLLHDRY